MGQPLGSGTTALVSLAVERYEFVDLTVAATQVITQGVFRSR
jgi:hypothetical protein